MESIFNAPAQDTELSDNQKLQLINIKRDSRNALVCSIVSLVLPFALVFQIVAVVLGIKALRGIERAEIGEQYRTRAVVAMCIAGVGLILMLLFIFR